MRNATVTRSRRRPDVNDKDLMALMASIASGNTAKVLEVVTTSPDLVQMAAIDGASRAAASQYFFPQIGHYLYAGDTALHIAAAGFKFELAQCLIDHGANCTAKNRRGAGSSRQGWESCEVKVLVPSIACADG
jgi:hypothetical protein